MTIYTLTAWHLLSRALITIDSLAYFLCSFPKKTPPRTWPSGCCSPSSVEGAQDLQPSDVAASGQAGTPIYTSTCTQ